MGNLTVWSLLGHALGLLIGFTLHEFAHAWTANRLGDDTPRFQRRITLDPRSHIEPMGLIMGLIIGFGWAKPVPVNPRAFYPNEKRGLMIVAAAGPLMNLVIALILSIPIRLILEFTGLFDIVSHSVSWFFFRVWLVAILFNLVLFFFNLVPLFPLDGWRVMLGLLPRERAVRLQGYEQQAMLILILILSIGIINERFNLIWAILGPPLRYIFEKFTGVPYWVLWW
ncbi:MAG: site-2 protease family protein [Chloroflexi bacterium]|nr:site-2 protease family protein [Chloroflexota bacterium]